MQGPNSVYGTDNSRRHCAERMGRTARVRSQHQSLNRVRALHCSGSSRWRNTERSWIASIRFSTFALQERSRSEYQKAAKGSHSNKPLLAISFSRSRTTNRPTPSCVASPGQKDIFWSSQTSRKRGHSMTVTRLRRGLRPAVALATTQP